MKTQISTKRIVATIIFVGTLVTVPMTSLQAQVTPGEAPTGYISDSVTISAAGSLSPQVTETGFISLSVDGLGAYPENTGIIQVEKPSGATVRGAYFAAATTGLTGYQLADGDITIDGVGINWDIAIPSSIDSYNYWADVTSVVSAKINAASPGRVSFTITETDTYLTDGEILAVIFDDPSQTTSNTIVLFFGAQDIAGDTFNIGLAEPLDKSNPDLVLDMSLGISYGYQPSGQFSLVDINGQRLTSSAGGQDDGADYNGALLTVGGLDDSNTNPDPYASDAGGPRVDDELYNLLPFVETGDTTITVETINPSNDDNIFFASLFLASTTAVVGEGILLAPVSATNEVGTLHTVTATVQDDDGNPIVGRDVTFTIISGPHAGQTSTTQTDSGGQAEFTYTGTLEGTDVIVASFVDSQGATITSNEVTKEWIGIVIYQFRIDIKPGSCPNPFNGKSQGSVPVAILGNAAFDVTEVDLDSLRLEGVPIIPKHVGLEDVSAPVGDPEDCYNCFDEQVDSVDGYLDLVLKFDTQELAAAIGPAPRDACVVLTLTGLTLSGEPFEASDSMVIKTKIKD
jgi:hypothetical protein